MQNLMYVCQTCGLCRERDMLCPFCTEPLAKITPEIELEYKKHAVIQDTVRWSKGSQWYL